MTKAVAVKKEETTEVKKTKKVAKSTPPVDNSNLLSFFKLIALSGDIECPEAIFDVNDGNLAVSVLSSDRTLAMKGNVRGEFEKFGQIGIGYLSDLSKFINTIGNNFSVSFEKNKMILKSAKSILTTTIQEAEYIVNKLEDAKYKKIEESIKNGFSVNLTKEVISDIVSKFNGVQAEVIQFLFGKNFLVVTLKNKSTGTTLQTEYEIECDMKEDFGFELNGRFNNLFDSLAKNMSKEDVVNVALAKDKGIAVAISLNNENFNLKYIVALLDREEK